MKPRHFFYRSCIVACTQEFDTIGMSLTAIRDEVTCSGCIAQLEKDVLICVGCRTRKTDSPQGHNCDPRMDLYSS